jgi:hypothetical protein
MQKAIGMGIIVLALWIAVELFTEGPADAFDGAFAGFVGEEELEDDYTWAPERAGNKLRASHAERAEAIERLTGE